MMEMVFAITVLSLAGVASSQESVVELTIAVTIQILVASLVLWVDTVLVSTTIIVTL